MLDIGQFIQDSLNCTSDEELFDLLNKWVLPLGLDRNIFCLMTDHLSIQEPAYHGKICGYPEDWMRHYQANNYQDIDPIRKEVMLSQRIFTWEKTNHYQPYNTKESRMMHEAEDAGLRDGVAVSLQNTFNEIVAFGFASSSGGVELSTETLCSLKLLSIQFYDCYQRLKSLRPTAGFRVHLTNREKEILQWVAQGKSNTVIGDILNISERTVNFHLQQAYQKLHTCSRTTAVLKAIRLGLIQMDEHFLSHMLQHHQPALTCQG
jgi:DNA-binding CsgD family transcriptional regulator